MKIKTVWLTVLTITGLGCGSNVSNDFEMTVEEVNELRGFVLKGIAISGIVQNGCIANEDTYQVKRDGKEVIETSARLLRVLKKDGAEPVEGEAVTGNFVEFYLPDRNKEDVQVGDVVISNITSCEMAVKE